MSARLFLPRAFPASLRSPSELRRSTLRFHFRDTLRLALVRNLSLQYRHQGPSYTPRQSGIGQITLLLIIGGFCVSGSILLYRRLETSLHKEENDLVHQPQVESDHIMVTAIHPGRPGNLTSEQTAKLQELWKVTLKVFGVSTQDPSGVNDTVNENLTADSLDENSLATLDKQKKKRKSLFGRKKVDAKDGDDTSGHASEAEDKHGQTKQFQKALASQSPEDLRKAFWSMVKHDHPDGLLLRFLRARKWDVEKALVMMISTMHWRSQEMHVDDNVMWNGEAYELKNTTSSDPALKKEGKDFVTQMRLGKSFLHGCDIEGRPMCLVRVRLHKQGEQSEASLERVTVHIIETARLLLSPPVDTAAIVFDMTGFSMANMDYAPVKFMIKIFEANYPESLGVVLVHKAPWIFQGIWTIIKGWLDPVVANKVHFTKNLEELEHYVPKSNIMKELGGDDPYTYEYIEPRTGENDSMLDSTTRSRLQEERANTVKEFEARTREWMQGSPSNADLMQKRNTLAEQLRKGYWQLDPYVRARSLYDRQGMILKGGIIQYYPLLNGSQATAASTSGPTPAGHNPDDLD